MSGVRWVVVASGGWFVDGGGCLLASGVGWCGVGRVRTGSRGWR